MKNTFEEEDDLKELLELELQREADLLEETLLSDEDTDELQISDEDTDVAFADLMRRLQNESAYQAGEKRTDLASSASESGVSQDLVQDAGMEVSDGKSTTFSKTNRAISARVKRFSFGKAAGFVIVVLLSVFAGTMTSEANRKYLLQRMHYLLGDSAQIVANNDEYADWAIRDEAEAIQEIEDTLGVKVPEFYYRPFSLRLSSLFLDKWSGTAQIEYSYSSNDTLAILLINDQTKNRTSFMTNVHGEKMISMPDLGIRFYIEKISNTDEETEYEATWIYNNTLYDFKGKIEWEEFEKMLMSIQYSR